MEHTLETSQRGLFVVDDHPIIRDGIRQLVDGEASLCVVGEASGSRDALESIRASSPDIVILDLNLSEDDGLDLLHKIRALRPDLPVLIFSMSDEELYAERCLKAGANGYLMKKENPRELLTAVQTVLHGKVFLSDAMKETVLLGAIHGHGGKISRLSSLTARELQIFRLLGEAQKTRAIGEQLHISPKTVHTHIENMKKKLALPDIRSLLYFAMQNAKH